MPSFSLAELCVIFFVLILFFTPKEIVGFLQKAILFFEKMKDEVENAKNEIILLPEEEEFTEINIEDEFTQSDAEEEKD